MTNNILIAVTGLTPQIVTEAFYCLTVQQKTPVHEIYIFTTQKGKEVLMGQGEKDFMPKTPFKKELYQLCKDYNVEIPKFEYNDEHIIVAREESVELPDIRTDEHNILFPNKVSEFLKEKSADHNNILYSVISGGRKSMSVHLSLAMTIFGRVHDKLYHVLTSEENEFKNFYPKNKEEDELLEISEIPFIRLRSFIASTNEDAQIFSKKYNEIVEFTQNKLQFISNSNKLVIDAGRKTLQYGDNSLRLEPLHFAFYFQFIQLNLEGKQGLSINDIVSDEFANKLKLFINENYGEYYLDDDSKSTWWKTKDRDTYFRQIRSKINQNLEDLLPGSYEQSQYKIESDRDYGNTKYFIPASSDKIQIT